MTEQLPEETYLNTKEAADYLHLSFKQMEAWRTRGNGPRFLKLAGKLVRYRRSDLDAFAASRVQESTSQTVLSILANQ